MSRIIIVVLLMMAMLSGCMSIREQMLSRGYNVEYVDGYDDGYVSGKYAAGDVYSRFMKNTYRYEIDSQYKQGWDDGFRVGKSKHEDIKQMFR